LPARLKVFAARMGFFDTIVAAPSQKAALTAWGVHQDLFKDGAAAPTADPAAMVALEHPGVVLRRMAGSADAYTETAAVDAAALPSPAKSKAKASAGAQPKPKPPPDRSALDAAERALGEAEGSFEAQVADIATRRLALEAEEAALQQRHEHRRAELENQRRRAEQAYRRAGGVA
jgi:hypothetical protein